MSDDRRESDQLISALEQKCQRLEQKLNEALGRQTATLDILKVISTSPKNAQPVFDSIVQAGLKLFPQATISVALHDEDQIIVAAIAGPNPEGVEAWRLRFPAPLRPDTIHGHVVLDGIVVDLPNVADAQDRYPMGAVNFMASGYKAVTMLPISQGGQTVGTIAVLRPTVGCLTDEEMELLRTFTAQANIAIENTQLLNEMRATNETLKNVSRQLSRYMPPQLYRSIMAGEQKAAIDSHRKKLTVFFSDIVDFTEITDQLEAEELTSLLNEYLSQMSTIAQEHGAYFDKFIGDAMMFYFGDQDSQGAEEDASNCVRMAIAMQRRLAELQAGWRKQGLIDRPFHARIGINTGYCTVGNFGSEERMDYTIIGSEVNLAARLEEEAEPGGILLASETFSLVKDWIAVEEQEPVSMKGFAKPVRTYAVQGIYDDCAGKGNLIHQEYDGYSLTLDPDRLNPEAKQLVIKKLKSVLSRLDSD